MDEKTILNILRGNSKELEEIRSNLPVFIGFLNLVNTLDGLPEINQSVSRGNPGLYHAVSINLSMGDLKQHFNNFFGPPVKPDGQKSSFSLRFNASAKFLGGIQLKQALFVKKLKHGEFYGSLAPSQRKDKNIIIHLGFCSNSMNEEDYVELELAVRKSLAQRSLEKIADSIGGRIHGINLPSFLQMAEMEKTTGTLTIQTGENKGYLYLQDGRIIDAETDKLQGRNAAYVIISWDKPLIEINSVCSKIKRRITLPLMSILMEGMRLKDENILPGEASADSDIENSPRKDQTTSTVHSDIEVTTRPAPCPGAKEEFAAEKKKKGSPISGNIWVLLFVFAFSLLTWKFVAQPLQIKKEYLNSLENIKNQPTLEEKAVLLQFYINTHFQGPYTSEAEERLKDIYRRIEDRDFDNMLLDIQLLDSNSYIADATAIYLEFIKKHSDSRYVKEIQDMLIRLPEIAEKQDYQALNRLEQHTAQERLTACRDFLSRYPESQHGLDVKKMIVGIHEEKFHTLQNRIALNRPDKNWDASILLCKVFLLDFKNHPQTEQVKKILRDLLHERDLAYMEKQVSHADSNPETLKLAYNDFLTKHPDSAEKENIQKQLIKLENRIIQDKNRQETLAYCQDNRIEINARISRLKSYIRDNPSYPLSGEAESLLTQLEIQQRNRIKKIQTDQKKKLITKQQRERQAQERRILEILKKQVIAGLDKSEGRFITSDGDTVTDTNSGLMWCIADSHLVLGGRCMTFNDALRYVRRLSTGNYNDWRLPSPSEFAELYKSRPYYPASGAKWYWTSEFSTMSWNISNNVIIFYPNIKDYYKKQSVDQNQCGAVHAVRP